MVNKDQEVTICYCEDISKKEIIEAIEKGYTTIESLKRQLRVGMGPCQGRNCLNEISKELGRKMGKQPQELKFPRVRLPLVPVPVMVWEKIFTTKDKR